MTTGTSLPRLRVSLPLDPSRLLRARERVRDYLGRFCRDRRLIDDVVLCVEEAATNAIRHGGGGELSIALAFEGADLVAEVRDHGRGFDVASVDWSQPPDPMSTGGRGLFLIARLMDDLQVHSNGGVTVHMVKRGVGEHCEPPAFETATGDLAGRRGERTKALLEEIDEGFVALDWEYRFIHANDLALRMVGKTADEVLGRTPAEVWPQAADDLTDLRFEEAMEFGRPSTFERYSPLTRSWVETRIYPTSSGIGVYFREITGRKRLEHERGRLWDALERSERGFRSTFEQAAVGMVHLDLDGRYLRLNRRFCELVGYRCAELEGRSYEEITAPDDLARERRLIADLLAGRGSDYSMDKRYVRPDGSLLWCSVTMSLVRDEEGAADYLVAVVEDLSERKAAEEDLARYRLLWQQARDAMLFVRRRDGRVLDANAAAERVYGWTRDELARMTIYGLRAGDTDGVVSEQMDEAAEKGLLFQATHRRADGGTFPAEISSRGVELQGEQVLLSVVRDVSERLELVGDLARERDALAAVMEHATSQIAYLDRDLRFRMVNDQYVTGSGHSRDELLGRGHFELFPDPENEAIFRRVLATGEQVEFKAKPFEFESHPERGLTYWDWRLAPVRSDGGVDGLVLSLVDVTDRVRRERYADALADILREATDQDAPEDARRVIAVRVREALGADVWAVWARDGETWAAVDQADEAAPLLAGRRLGSAEAPVAVRVEASGEVVVVDDVAGADVAAVAHETGVRSLIAAPLATRQYPFAVLFFGWRAGREHTPAETDFVRRVAEATADVVDKVALYRDLAERERLGTALNDVTGAITSSLDDERILETVVSTVAAAIGADTSAISMLQGEEWVPRYLWRLPPELRGRPVPRSQVPYGEQGVAGKRVVAVDDTETDERVDRDLQRAWGVRSVMLAPILVRDTVVAGLFFNYGAPHRFSELEIDFATKAAALVTAALENARLYDSQRRVAVTLQESFLHELPAVAGMEIGVSSQTAYEPDLVGGDFHDVFELASGRVLVLVGDVEGKGVRAAGLTETVRSSVRALALVDPSPGRILGKANQLLLTEQQQQFVTAALVLVDVGREVATFASAGHPAPLLIGATGGAEVQVPAGTPLGAFGWSYGEATVELARGDTVVLYTDGLTEARREGELFGSERALRMALDHRDDDPERLAEALRAAASAFGGRLADDLQVVAFRLTGGF